MKTTQNDMTVGDPMRIILSFTMPIFIGNVFQQFYNMADTIIVGKFVGNSALAAVGSTGTIMFMLYGFVVGMTAGFTVLTAQKFGAGDMKGMRRTVAGAGILSLVMGILLTILFMTFMKPLLTIMHTPSDIFADAYSYIMIVSAGILAQMLYNLLSSILRAIGNSKIPLVFLIISALLNIVLDMVFIIAFGMGAKGAGMGVPIDFARRFRCALPVLYYCKGAGAASEKGRPACWRRDLWYSAQDWYPDGAAVFDHGNRYDDGAVFIKHPRFHAGGCVHRRQQDRAGHDAGVCGHGNDDGDLWRTEYGSR